MKTCYFYLFYLISIKTLQFGLWLWNAINWCVVCNVHCSVRSLHLVHKIMSLCFMSDVTYKFSIKFAVESYALNIFK
jgi:hypothetical protein